MRRSGTAVNRLYGKCRVRFIVIQAILVLTAIRLILLPTANRYNV